MVTVSDFVRSVGFRVWRARGVFGVTVAVSACVIAVTGSSRVKAQIAATATSNTADVALSAQYADDLNLQLDQIRSEVAYQLTSQKAMDTARASVAAHRFVDSVAKALAKPLALEQFQQVFDSLSRRHLWLLAPYPDMIDLEAEYYTLIWTDYIRLYVARSPMTTAQRELITQQFVELIGIAGATMDDHLRGLPEAAEVPRIAQCLSDLLYRDLDDPVIPAAKRPFSQEELKRLEDWVTEEITKALRDWFASPDYMPGHASVALMPVMTHLWAKASETQYIAPSLSPDLMQQMRAERRALIAQRARWFDDLPEAEKEREFQRMMEREKSGTE